MARECVTLRGRVHHTLVSVSSQCQHARARATKNSCVDLSNVVRDLRVRHTSKHTVIRMFPAYACSSWWARGSRAVRPPPGLIPKYRRRKLCTRARAMAGTYHAATASSVCSRCRLTPPTRAHTKVLGNTIVQSTRRHAFGVIPSAHCVSMESSRTRDRPLFRPPKEIP